MEPISQESMPFPAPDDFAGALVRGPYRYLLWRTWDATGPRLLWILLNPSLADAQTNDPTLRRCCAFSRAWGYGGLQIVNLFAYRTPYPEVLRQVADPVGSENDAYIVTAAQRAAGIILAWGHHGRSRSRDSAVLALLAQQQIPPLRCLGLTRAGCPRHPLYMRIDVKPLVFSLTQAPTSPVTRECPGNEAR
jgi:hypothetical protein